MLKSIKTDDILYFAGNAIIIVNNDLKAHLVGPGIFQSSELNALEAYFFHCVKTLKSFSFGQLQSKVVAGISDNQEATKLLLLKFLNKLINLKVLVDRPALKDHIPQFKLVHQFSSTSKSENIRIVSITEKHLVAYQWALALSFQLKTDSKIYDDGLFFGNCYQDNKSIIEDIELLLSEIKGLVDCYYNEELSIPKKVEDREYLWRVHQIFEKYYSKIDNDEANIEADGLKERLRRLNYLIHQAEDAVEDGDGGFVEIVFSNQTKPIYLPEKCDELFSKDFIEKYIYLNYFQIGYSVLAAFEAKTDSTPIPQTQYSANHFLYFRPDNILSDEKISDIKKWVSEKFSGQLRIEEFRLGHIPLAKIESQDGTDQINEKLKRCKILSKIDIENV